MKGAAVETTTASSDVDVNATGRRGKDERARVDGPAYAPRQRERLIVVIVVRIRVRDLDRRSGRNGLRDAAHVRPAPPTRQRPDDDAQLVGACHGRIERRDDSRSQRHACAQAPATPRTGAAVICIRFLPNKTKILRGGRDSTCREFGPLALRMLKEFRRRKSCVNYRSDVVLPPSVLGTSGGGGAGNSSGCRDGSGGKRCLSQAPTGRRWRSRNDGQGRRMNGR
jgi:hypothetical protein